MYIPACIFMHDQLFNCVNPLHACIFSCLQHACIFSCLLHALSLCMHENACKRANLHACLMHASCLQCMHVSCMPCMHDSCMQCRHAQFRRALPFLEKKKPFWEMTIHPHPHLKPLYSKRFLQSTSTSLLIINPLHSRVAHRSFDFNRHQEGHKLVKCSTKSTEGNTIKSHSKIIHFWSQNITLHKLYNFAKISF